MHDGPAKISVTQKKMATMHNLWKFFGFLKIKNFWKKFLAPRQIQRGKHD